MSRQETSPGGPHDVQRYFGQHARAYAVSERHARGSDLGRLLDALDPQPGQAALDLATGPGHVALRLAERGLKVTAADLTPEMLAVARAAEQERPLPQPIAWIEADAAQLPCPDGQFDAVVCRRAAHHFPDLPRVLRESRRVLKPGGRLAVSDMTAPAASMDALNEVERLRDRSHAQAQTVDQWIGHLLDAGFGLQWVELTVEPMTREEWLAPVAPDSPEGQAAFERMDRWPEAVRQALYCDDTFLKYRVLLVGVRR